MKRCVKYLLVMTAASMLGVACNKNSLNIQNSRPAAGESNALALVLGDEISVSGISATSVTCVSTPIVAAVEEPVVYKSVDDVVDEVAEEPAVEVVDEQAVEEPVEEVVEEQVVEEPVDEQTVVDEPADTEPDAVVAEGPLCKFDGAEYKLYVKKIDSVSTAGMTFANAVVSMVNTSPLDITVERFKAALILGRSGVGSVVYNGGMVIPANSEQTFSVPVNVSLTNLLGAYALLAKLRNGDLSGLTLTANIDMLWNGMRHEIKAEGISVEELLMNMGYTAKDLQNKINKLM